MQGVSKVYWAPYKKDLGNDGDHYVDRNIMVTSTLGIGSASNPFEFELTRNQHMKDQPGLPFTVTAMFKEPSPGLVPEAWQIFCAAVKRQRVVSASHCQIQNQSF